MNVAEFTKIGTMAMIKATQDPTAAIKIPELYKFANLVGKMLGPCSDRKLVARIDELLNDWDAGDGCELDQEETARTPEFIIVLCASLCAAIVGYTEDLVKNYKEEDQEAGENPR